MSDGLIVRYVGFQNAHLVREYSFTVREAGKDRGFTVNIEHEAFVSHRVRYQDAPDICAQRLQAELAAHENHPQETQYLISSAELEVYRTARLPKSNRNTYGRSAD